MRLVGADRSEVFVLLDQVLLSVYSNVAGGVTKVSSLVGIVISGRTCAAFRRTSPTKGVGGVAGGILGGGGIWEKYAGEASMVPKHFFCLVAFQNTR